MADFGTPVAQNVTGSAQSIQTLSSLLGIKQQQQALQTGQYAQASAKAQSTIDTQTATENQALAKLMTDPVGAGIVDRDGNPTADGLSIVMRAAPTHGADTYGKLVNAARSKIEFNTSLNNLNQQEQAEIGSVAAGAAAGARSPGEVKDALAQLVQSKAGTPTQGDYQKITGIMSQVIDHAAQVPTPAGAAAGSEPWRQAALGLGRRVLGAPGIVGSGGIAQPTEADVNSGAIQSQGVRAPALMGGGFTPSTSVTNVAPPAIANLPSGQLGSVGGVNGVPSSSNAPPAPPSKLPPIARPAPNAPRADQENYQAQIAEASKTFSAIQSAANDPMNGVQATRFRNQQILDLLPHASTGPGLRILNILASRLPGASGDAYQDIEHYTAQNSAALAKTMGVPSTNLGAETAAAAAGSVERNPGALAEITKTNDALNSALDLYNRGLARVTNNGSDMSRVPAYRQAFGQNLDINAIRWADAHRRGDTQEIARLQSQLGPKGIAAAQQHLRIVKALSDTGDLP